MTDTTGGVSTLDRGSLNHGRGWTIQAKRLEQPLSTSMGKS